ncbi:TonB-dependent receptor [Helicobacter valdiviensis]|uniref:TonB-dependent receptor n=1 Tax=Helicobacter valdiviensis TaxID=1458358 RepID=A0A2W6MV31_9HELI|nr:TonB-dependent receptor [Helicobacter valdiviensis]PZT47779.1 TonB-dependent receptor [Helicobacter valdiviensis]
MKIYLGGALALALLYSSSLNAVETYSLDTSVVSATGFEQDVKDAPASISVITKEELQSRPIRDIADAIKDVPGVDVSVSKLGTYSFNIRGFGSDYVLVLVDGKRQNATRGFQGNGFGEATNAYLPPVSMIERIEVIKGPASTLYGGDAVGGVINIITKKNPDTFMGSISLDTQAQQHFNKYGHSRGVSGYIAFPLVKDTLSLSLRGSLKQREKSNLKWPTQTDKNNPNTIYASHSPGAFDMGNIGARLNWTLDSQNNIYLDAEHFTQKTAVNSTSSKAVSSHKKFNKNGLILNHDGYYGFGSVNTYLQANLITEDGSKSTDYTTGVTTQGAKIKSEVYIAESKAVIPIDLQKYGSVSLSSGIQYMHENFITFADTAGALKGKDQDQNTIAPYVEAEYYITDDLILTGGIRYTKSDLFSGEVIPRGYLVYHLTDLITLKGGVAKGYKTPEAKVLTSGEYSEGYYGNPNLKPETSTNYEIGAIFEIPQYGNFSLTAFQTDFKDELSSDSYELNDKLPNGITCSVVDGCYYEVNRGKNQAKGIEFATQTRVWNGFSANASYTYMEKHYKSGETRNVFGGTRVENMPRHTAIIKLNYTQGKFSSFLKATGRYDTLAKSKGGGNRAIPGLNKYDNFYIFDLGFSYKMTKNSQVNFVINNLLDKDFFVPYGYENKGKIAYANRYQDYTEGRSFWLNYKLDF